MMSDGHSNHAPPIARILETALYVDDLPRALAFYDGLFGFQKLFESETLTALDVGGASVLLLFKRGGSAKTQALPGGTIPPHDGSGPLHVAFPVDEERLAEWEARLAARGIAVEGRVTWPRGGTSVYFRDPDGHLLELATPGMWATY